MFNFSYLHGKSIDTNGDWSICSQPGCHLWKRIHISNIQEVSVEASWDTHAWLLHFATMIKGVEMSSFALPYEHEFMTTLQCPWQHPPYLINQYLAPWPLICVLKSSKSYQRKRSGKYRFWFQKNYVFQIQVYANLRPCKYVHKCVSDCAKFIPHENK